VNQNCRGIVVGYTSEVQLDPLHLASLASELASKIMVGQEG